MSEETKVTTTIRCGLCGRATEATPHAPAPKGWFVHWKPEGLLSYAQCDVCGDGPIAQLDGGRPWPSRA
jgi:hypothetical protein